MTFSKRSTTLKSRLSSSHLSSGVMTYPSSSTFMVLSLFPCTHFFCLTIWASRRRSCLVWGVYSWRNRHPNSLALSHLFDNTRQFHVCCPWNCFRKNALLASSIFKCLFRDNTTEEELDFAICRKVGRRIGQIKGGSFSLQCPFLCCTLVLCVFTHVLAVFCRMRK